MTRYNTATGPIFYDHSGNDHRPNIRDSRPAREYRHEAVKLQAAAVRSFRIAERRLGRRVNSGPWRFRLARAIRVTGSWRSFDLQRALYAQDSKRYASPYTSGHVQAIAVDLDTNYQHFEAARNILRDLGWKQVRADEPWHWSYGVAV